MRRVPAEFVTRPGATPSVSLRSAWNNYPDGKTVKGNIEGSVCRATGETGRAALILNRIGKGSCKTHGERPRI